MQVPPYAVRGPGSLDLNVLYWNNMIKTPGDPNPPKIMKCVVLV